MAAAEAAETKVETEAVIEDLKKEESTSEIDVLATNANAPVKPVETTSATENAAVLLENTRVPGSTKVKTAKFEATKQLNLVATGGKLMTSSYKAGSPTKSPSSGLHKPTWKPSSKPAEHRKLAGSPTKSPSSGLHKPTWRPSSKPVEHSSKSSIGAALPRRKLAGSPTKSPSSGLHKPTWKPSSKPAEHRTLKVNDNGDEVDCPPKEGEESSAPAGKQGASFILDAPAKGDSASAPKQMNLMATGGSSYKAGSPTKSPSSGLHKPTWKPSSKPNEHRKLGSAAMKAAAKSSSSSSSSDAASTSKKTIVASKVTPTNSLV